MNKKLRQNPGYVTSFPERLSYGTYLFGQNLIYNVVAGYLLVFYTDIGIAAATVALILFVAKIWDAINDPIFGGIMDRIRFRDRIAKFLPWLRLSLPFIAIFTVMIYAVPATIPLGAKIAWSMAAYLLYDTFYTMCDAPIYGMVTTMTTNQKERTSIMTYGRLFAVAGSTGVGLVLPAIRQPVGGWFPTVVIFAVLALATMLPFCIIARERVSPAAALTKREKGYSFKEIGYYLAHNKYLLIFYLAFLVSGVFGFTGAFGMYFARYNLGDESLLALMSAVSIPVGLGVYAVFPFLCRRFEKYWLFFWSAVAGGVVNLIAFLVGYGNIVLYIAIKSGIGSIPGTINMLLIFMFTPDCVEYGAYKTGINASGMAFSIQTFVAKLIAAISSALAALTLAAIGFIEGEGAAQLSGFEDKIWLLYNIFPLVGTVLTILVLLGYKLRDHDVELMAKANTGEISRQEAEAGFRHKF
ncbi:MAG: glycoside-pentoside-hexuronide (GPH):cation symporter [Treponema sp.]|jgi:sugar (glycoside-pentoside-hexuronide) transporter|nr:glycoside-pentoside-hexuronide (GPH):cation symporter [Treponema sp.]